MQTRKILDNLSLPNYIITSKTLVNQINNFVIRNKLSSRQWTPKFMKTGNSCSMKQIYLLQENTAVKVVKNAS